MTQLASDLAWSRRRFDAARKKAAWQDAIAILTHHSDDLLAFDMVGAYLHARQKVDRGTQMIELDRIVGSVGRYRDFTRQFLPRATVKPERWARLDSALNDLAPIPPIDVYQVGDVYFVADGNHRVSVARANGLRMIEANVVEIPTPVTLTPGVTVNELIVKAEYAGFLKQTRLDELRPNARIELTVPGGYRRLLEHVESYCCSLRVECQIRVPQETCMTRWYDEMYLPVVQAVCDSGTLAEFPGRTEGDLYIWIADHLHELREEYGPAVEPASAAADFARRRSRRLGRRVRNVATQLARKWADPGAVPEIVEDLLKQLEAREEAGDIP